ncbi:MAG TPA: hypothetical protein VNW53_17705 [Phenylobacterium sp.]|jgi:hypothetical protein|uniref:hypothetical protein n=1 Tax=Phenylobacterium sp. TaxID=1871053 RepID=UPI002C1C249B|nr:hypothetical protein [Phenylobacterium sp.]HXA40840.1 hypothetical protein [Phenylobacterium sp.]
MSQGLEILRLAHILADHPLRLVVVLALIAALIEQRLTRRRTPDFSFAYRDIHGAPPKPKSKSRPPKAAP